MSTAQHTREVSLNALDRCLKGVVALGHELVTVGDSGGRAAILNAIRNAADTEAEVQSFVRSLLDHDAIELHTAKKGAKTLVGASRDAKLPTHVIGNGVPGTAGETNRAALIAHFGRVHVDFLCGQKHADSGHRVRRPLGPEQMGHQRGRLHPVIEVETAGTRGPKP